MAYLIFTQWKQVLTGDKTETRRGFKKGQVGIPLTDDGYYSKVLDADGKLVYAVGQVLAARPWKGRMFGRIEITRLRLEDVRHISDEDVLKEGFKTRTEFLTRWAKIADKELRTRIVGQTVFWMNNGVIQQGTDQQFEQFLLTRPDSIYLAWVLTYTLIEKRVELGAVSG